MRVEIGLKEIKEAANRIKKFINRTPCVPSQRLSEHYNRNIYLKLENLQITGGFKIRGNANKLSSLSNSELGSGVVTASSGNHGLGLSLSAKHRFVNATIVVPKRTPWNKIEKLKKYGAEVIINGDNYDEAVLTAKEIEKNQGFLYIPSFDDLDIITGNGTIGLEIYEDVPDTNLVVCPIGGGGGISGIGLALKGFSPSIRVIGVEAQGASSMKYSLIANKCICLEKINTLADGIAVRQPGRIPFEIVKDIVEEIIVVSDDEMKKALCQLVLKDKIVPELAGAASVAALSKIKLPKFGAIVCLISGGNIDQKLLVSILKQYGEN